jgi:hypothetical protein
LLRERAEMEGGEAMAGIKDLVDLGLQEVPSIYVRPLHERPLALDPHLPAQQLAQLPVIDLSPLLPPQDADYADGDGDGDGDGGVDPTLARSLVIQQIADACRDWGFFQVLRSCSIALSM